MKFAKSSLLPVIISLIALTTFQACKTKKAGIGTNPYGTIKEEPEAEKPEAPAPEPKKTEPVAEPVKESPDFNFRNIQFEFNSVVLKTVSYPILDKAATEMKKDVNVRFIINGHSSTEGSAEHNMSLSRDRANSVKTYLVNAGIGESRLTTKGYGETKPITNNDTEESRALNRRVEIEIAP
ncbi:OmpA family protein [Arcticibacter sp.]|uniref:OmpA family protein n=1 Tax=Arcticibacter sp. TaxID=1872630 RepID=UPI00388EF65C